MEITSLTRHILEIMVSKFSNIIININKVIDNRSTFFSGGVTSCTRNVKYFCHLSVQWYLIKELRRTLVEIGREFQCTVS